MCAGASTAPRSTSSSSCADIREGHGEAYYVPSHDFISMPAFAAFKGSDHFYNVAFHELTHWTWHKARLARDLKNQFGSRHYAAEELVAELGAAFLSAEFGFDGDVRNTGYIANWIELLKADKRAKPPRPWITSAASCSPSLPGSQPDQGSTSTHWASATRRDRDVRSLRTVPVRCLETDELFDVDACNAAKLEERASDDPACASAMLERLSAAVVAIW